MIDYIKYTVDGETYNLIDNGDGTWSKSLDAPDVAGNYNLILEVSESGIVTIIDSSDPRYEFYLDVIETTEKRVHLQNYVPEFLNDILEFNLIYEIENKELDEVYASIEKLKGDMFIRTASAEMILRLENFLRIKGMGTLEQRKNYLLTLFQKGKKLNEGKIKEVTNTIVGADCIVTFFSSDELNNPEPGYGILRVQVLSPENGKDYRYDDIFRTLKPSVPGHLKLLVIKYFALWGDIKTNFTDWNTVKAMTDWQAVKSYIPPQ